MTGESTTRKKRSFTKPTGKDVVSGFVTGLFSIPEGMAYASIGGFSAPLGLWSGIVPTIFGSVLRAPRSWSRPSRVRSRSPRTAC